MYSWKFLQRRKFTYRARESKKSHLLREKQTHAIVAGCTGQKPVLQASFVMRFLKHSPSNEETIRMRSYRKEVIKTGNN